MANKVWKKEEIKDLLLKNDRVLLRGIVTIYSLQTSDERDAEGTRYYNGVGFNGRDAKFMSSLAEQILKRGTLSVKQMALARKKMVKYAGQLTKVSNGEIQVTLLEGPGFKDIKKKLAPKIDAALRANGWSPADNDEWARMKDEFAAMEREMEEEAFRSKMDKEMAYCGR